MRMDQLGCRPINVTHFIASAVVKLAELWR